ncbi:GDSL-type esterase/lipase family protein [Companilactobacillus allii]|uniref:Lipase n=1 Tax=Companilactobacillus allii TaxID=1847728 RepID=A0A1P8Q4W9_9LACO|nr:GDSL-type esterase/lipase family protein [Companilactobacillus allii]APX72907.1 lipase [Companilactobacillus allii]USQ67695.1 GDSL-type esterase/lipase family protein [Companilactobacillus allii]
MKKKSTWIIIIVVILVAIGGVLGYYFTQSKTEPTTNNKTEQVVQKKKKKIVVKKKSEINIVAIGDSLTQGVGDSKSVGGGYVTRLKSKVTKKYKVKTNAYNYGVSGDTSNQIMTRIQNDDSMHKDLPKADIITVTVGGNDFMHLLKRKGLDLTESDITTEQGKFDERLKQLLSDIRSYNSDAPIYLIGIYNPFSIYLSNVKYAKTAFINWNKASAQIAEDQKDTYFININNLYQPSDKILKKNGDNPYLYTGDHFHPNGKGYDMMTDQVFNKVSKTTKEWLIK